MMMKRVTLPIEVSEETARALADLAARCNDCCAIADGFASHGASFSAASLLAMLAEDAAKLVTDPESWQAANLRHVLAAHGYRVVEREESQGSAE